MRVLCLGPKFDRLTPVLERCGDEIVLYNSRIEDLSSREMGCDFLISYGYSYILPSAIVQHYWRRAINLHISLLPWNRGSDPNLWSFLEDSPKGVTIHYIEEGVDSGEILAQREIVFSTSETLRSSYDKASAAIESLFDAHWPQIRSGTQPSRPQPAGGSIHRYLDRTRYESLLTRGWDTPVSAIVGKARK